MSISGRASSALAGTTYGRRVRARIDELRRRRFALTWTNVFGVVALACVVVLFVTGILLLFVYTPSSAAMTYHGAYEPLQGVRMSKALGSTLALTFDVRGGLLLRQLHHWSALLLPGALILQLVVTYFTGGFRRPRRLSWMLLFGVVIVALLGGWSGYAMPDDMLSGTGLRIFQGIVLGIPFIGTWASSLLFGGGFPGDIIEHLYPIHVVMAPVLLVTLMVLRAQLASRIRPAEPPSPRRTDSFFADAPAWPVQAVRCGGMLALVVALLTVVAGAVTVDPIWLYGPSDPGNASAGSQPDWYTGFLDGALRLVPPGWDAVWLGHTWSLSVLVPLAVVGVFLAAVLTYPLFEEWITGDRTDHHLLDRPRNAPTRTAIGVAGIVFYGALWGAGSADLVATHFGLSVESVVGAYWVLVLFGPVAAFALTRRVCLGLQSKDREILHDGYETGRIVRLSGGEYIEVRRQVDAVDRVRLQPPVIRHPAVTQPGATGSRRLRDRLRLWFWTVTPRR